MPDDSRVLDIGAGPGHLEYEFYNKFPQSNFEFTLIDASYKLLNIAKEKVKEFNKEIETHNRSFNMPGWNEDLGKYNAIVSTNALFHILPENLDNFYGTCRELMLNQGFMLNLQSFGWENGINPYTSDNPFDVLMRSLPKSIMPQLSTQLREDKEKLDESKKKIAEDTKKAVEEAKAAGVEFVEGQTGYQFLSVEHHLESMREAGFHAGCIWRKREFAVICGIKE